MVLERQSGILSKVLPRLVGVVHDLGGEGLEGGELPLLPQVLVKLHLDLLAVEVAVEIQDEALDGQLVAVVDGGRVPTLVTARWVSPFSRMTLVA